MSKFIAFSSPEEMRKITLFNQKNEVENAQNSKKKESDYANI